MKSRGMKHSNQVREFVISDNGLDLLMYSRVPDGVLTGSKRREQQLQEMTGDEMREYVVGVNNKEIERKRRLLEAKITTLQEEFEAVRDALSKAYEQDDFKKEILEKKRAELAKTTGNHKW
jgi:circadian clock protein KaiC